MFDKTDPGFLKLKTSGKIVLLVSLLGVLLLALEIFYFRPQEKEVLPTREFILRYDKPVHHSEGGFVLELAKHNDSRCPREADCFWPGQAEVTLRYQRGDIDKTFSLIAKVDEVIVENYSFMLTGLVPYPVAGLTFERAQYKAVIEIRPIPVAGKE